MAGSFEGVGSLPQYVAKARERGATAITLMMWEIDMLEERIQVLAQTIEAQALASADVQYLKEMEEAEAEAIRRQAEGEGWA